MGKKKRAPVTDAAESSGTKKMDDIRKRDQELVKKNRKRMERIRLEVAALAPEDDNFLARSMVENLETLSKKLMLLLNDQRNQIIDLVYEIESLAADQAVLTSIEQEVFRIVLFSSYCDAADCWTEDLAAALKAVLPLYRRERDRDRDRDREK